MDVLAGAVRGIARELGVLGRNRDGLRFRILRGCYAEVSVNDCFGVGPEGSIEKYFGY